ncbi:unnamed protein product, partial [Ectocarpus sp. 8 AP-2014]
IEIQEKVLGADHPSLAKPLNARMWLFNCQVWLAFITLLWRFAFQGKYEEADVLNRRAIEVQEVLGPDHPSLA